MEEAEANELANAKVLNVKQFRQLWNDLPPAGSFSCSLKSRPEMKTLVAHMETQGFFVVFASSTGRGLEDENDFELGISNMKGQDYADNAKSPFRGGRGRAVAVDNRQDLAEGLGQGNQVDDGRHSLDAHLDHKWFLARFRCGVDSFSAVMKTEEPATMNKYVHRFKLAKVLKVDATRPV